MAVPHQTSRSFPTLDSEGIVMKGRKNKDTALFLFSLLFSQARVSANVDK